MKNVTIMMLAASAALVASATAPALAHVRGDVPGMTIVVSDLPVAAPERTSSFNSGAFVADNWQLSGSSYFYAPGTGPRCEIRMKRVQGRIYQACE